MEPLRYFTEIIDPIYLLELATLATLLLTERTIFEGKDLVDMQAVAAFALSLIWLELFRVGCTHRFGQECG